MRCLIAGRRKEGSESSQKNYGRWDEKYVAAFVLMCEFSGVILGIFISLVRTSDSNDHYFVVLYSYLTRIRLNITLYFPLWNKYES